MNSQGLSQLHTDEGVLTQPPSLPIPTCLVRKPLSAAAYYSLTQFFFKATEALGFSIICDNDSMGPEAQRHFLLPVTVIHGGAPWCCGMESLKPTI